MGGTPSTHRRVGVLSTHTTRGVGARNPGALPLKWKEASKVFWERLGPPPGRAASEKQSLHHALVWPQNLKTRLKGILPVQIFSIANMVVDIRHELRFDVRQHQFPHGKVYRDVVLRPDGPLDAHGTIRTTANPTSLLLDSLHHGHGQHTRRVTDLQ